MKGSEFSAKCEQLKDIWQEFEKTFNALRYPSDEKGIVKVEVKRNWKLKTSIRFTIIRPQQNYDYPISTYQATEGEKTYLKIVKKMFKEWQAGKRDDLPTIAEVQKAARNTSNVWER